MASSIGTVRTVKDLRAQVAKWREAGESVGLVTTMGALHAGHLSLIALARKNADRVVASIFVNPTQFGPREDFGRYPRDEAGDVAKLAEAGVDLVYIPDQAEMYPPGFTTRVIVQSLTDDLCGAARPNHFEGVATVVTKLLLQCAPDFAVFGEKDYQQLLVIRRLVTDLNIPVRILGAPIVREEDGVALVFAQRLPLAAGTEESPPLLPDPPRRRRRSRQRRGLRRRLERRALQARGGRLSRRLYRHPRSRDAGAAVAARSEDRRGCWGPSISARPRLIDNLPAAPKNR